MAEVNFNTNDYEPDAFPPPIPEDDYELMVTDSKLVNAKSGKGKYFAVALQVLSGEYKNRIVQQRYNIIHSSDTTERIGRQEFRQLCDAVGVTSPKDTAELHNIPFLGHVVCRPYGDGIINELKRCGPRRQGGQKAMATNTETQPAGTKDPAPW